MAIKEITIMNHFRRFLCHSPKRKITLVTGDSNSSKIFDRITNLLQSINAPIVFDIFEGTPTKGQFNSILDSIRANKIALKGSWITDLDNPHESFNHALRRELDLWANVVHVKSQPFFQTLSALDFVIIRQNTEGEYSQIEHETVPGYVEMFKVITQKRSHQIAEFAFEYAKNNARKKITCIHKANIMKMSDGLFLNTCREVASRHYGIELNDMIVDNAAMQLVMRPHAFDILLTPNLYGNILVSIANGLIGNNHLLAGVNYNPEQNIAVFESAIRTVADNDSDSDYTNPTSILMASCKLLKHIGEPKMAHQLENIIIKMLKEGKHLTPDLGGKLKCSEYLGILESTYKSSYNLQN